MSYIPSATEDFCLTTSPSPHPDRLLCVAFLGCLDVWHAKNSCRRDYHPGGDSTLASYLPLKILGWGGYRYFLEMHILTFNLSHHTFVHNTQNTASNQTNHQIFIGDADCHNNFISEMSWIVLYMESVSSRWLQTVFLLHNLPTWQWCKQEN